MLGSAKKPRFFRYLISEGVPGNMVEAAVVSLRPGYFGVIVTPEDLLRVRSFARLASTGAHFSISAGEEWNQ